MGIKISHIKIAVLLVSSMMIGGCVSALKSVNTALSGVTGVATASHDIGTGKGKRNRMHADIMQAWVGKKADDLVSGSWGPPKSIYNNHDGTKLYTYADEWQTGYNAWENKSYWGTCTRKFNVDALGIIQKWGISGTCWELEQKVPNTPIPKSTL